MSVLGSNITFKLSQVKKGGVVVIVSPSVFIICPKGGKRHVIIITKKFDGRLKAPYPNPPYVNLSYIK